jgi:hypothetical protein
MEQMSAHIAPALQQVVQQSIALARDTGRHVGRGMDWSR